jgi:membrane-bound lytic murein transglycosylase B
MQRRTCLALLAALVASPSLATTKKKPATPARAPYSTRPEVQAFLAEFVSRHGGDEQALARLLDSARYDARVERLMQPPIAYGQRNWTTYRSRYLESARLAAGLAFWEANAATLARAQEQFGVPAEVIVAIIGIETYYGRITGRFRILDVLMTLAFDYTRRADYYRAELEQFLLLGRERALDARNAQGSFAGAMGLPQFMPGSMRRWALDYDGDGRIDLAGSPADAIGSVANFLVQHGWQAGEPAMLEAVADEATAEALGRGIEAKFPWSELQARGVTSAAPLAPETLVLLVDLPVVQADGSVVRDWRVGTRSYAAVLGYNRSYFYATAVLEFAQMLAAARAATPAAKRPAAAPGERAPTEGDGAERATAERGAAAAAAPGGTATTPRPAEASAGSR